MALDKAPSAFSQLAGMKQKHAAPATQIDPLDIFNQQVASVLSKPPPMSKDKMNKVVKSSLRAHKQVKKVIMSIEKFIVKCEQDYKVCGLYIMDMVLRVYRKKHPQEYAIMQDRFGSNLKVTLKAIWDCVKFKPENSVKIKKVLNIWKKELVFPNSVFYSCKDILRQSDWGLALLNDDNQSRQDMTHDVQLAITAQSRAGVKKLQEKLGEDGFKDLQNIINKKIGLPSKDLDHNRNHSGGRHSSGPVGDNILHNMDEDMDDIPDDFEHMNRIVRDGKNIPPPKWRRDAAKKGPVDETNDEASKPSYHLLPEPPEHHEIPKHQTRTFDAPTFNNPQTTEDNRLRIAKTASAPKVGLTADSFLAKFGVEDIGLNFEDDADKLLKRKDRRTFENQDQYEKSPDRVSEHGSDGYGRHKKRRKEIKSKSPSGDRRRRSRSRSMEKTTIVIKRTGDQTSRHVIEGHRHHSDDLGVTDEQIFGTNNNLPHPNEVAPPPGFAELNLPDPESLPNPAELPNPVPPTHPPHPPASGYDYGYGHQPNPDSSHPNHHPSNDYGYDRGHNSQHNTSGYGYDNNQYGYESHHKSYREGDDYYNDRGYKKDHYYENRDPRSRDPRSRSGMPEAENPPKPAPERIEVKFIDRKDYPEDKLIIFASTLFVGGIPKNFFGVESRLRATFEKRGKVSKVTHVKAKGVAYVEFANHKDAVKAIDYYQREGQPCLTNKRLKTTLTLGSGFEEFFGEKAHKLKKKYYYEDSGKCFVPFRYIPKKQKNGDMCCLKNGNFVDLGKDLKIPDDIIMRFIDPKVLKQSMIEKGLIEKEKEEEKPKPVIPNEWSALSQQAGANSQVAAGTGNNTAVVQNSGWATFNSVSEDQKTTSENTTQNSNSSGLLGATPGNNMNGWATFTETTETTDTKENESKNQASSGKEADTPSNYVKPIMPAEGQNQWHGFSQNSWADFKSPSVEDKKKDVSDSAAAPATTQPVQSTKISGWVSPKANNLPPPNFDNEKLKNILESVKDNAVLLPEVSENQASGDKNPADDPASKTNQDSNALWNFEKSENAVILSETSAKPQTLEDQKPATNEPKTSAAVWNAEKSEEPAEMELEKSENVDQHENAKLKPSEPVENSAPTEPEPVQPTVQEEEEPNLNDSKATAVVEFSALDLDATVTEDKPEENKTVEPQLPEEPNDKMDEDDEEKVDFL